VRLHSLLVLQSQKTLTLMASHKEIAYPAQSIIPKLFITSRTCLKLLRESNQTAPTKPSTVEAIVVRNTSSP